MYPSFKQEPFFAVFVWIFILFFVLPLRMMAVSLSALAYALDASVGRFARALKRAGEALRQ
jgi:hypothetical protein